MNAVLPYSLKDNEISLAELQVVLKQVSKECIHLFYSCSLNENNLEFNQQEHFWM